MCALNYRLKKHVFNHILELFNGGQFLSVKRHQKIMGPIFVECFNKVSQTVPNFFNVFKIHLINSGHGIASSVALGMFKHT